MHSEEQGRRPRTPLGAIAIAIVLGIAVAALAAKYRQGSALLADANADLTQSRSESAQAKTSLDDANARLAGLQRQLDAAKVQQADLKSRLDSETTQRSDLQSRLDKAQAELRSQRASERIQMTESQARLDQAAAESAQLRTDLGQARSQAADLRSRLAKAESDLASRPAPAINLPVMPVEASFAKPFFSSAYTLRLRNLNPGPLTVAITVNGSNAPKARSAVIDGGATLAVGGLAAGQNVVVRSDDFAPLSLAVK